MEHPNVLPIPTATSGFTIARCEDLPQAPKKPTTPGLAGEDIVGFLSIFLFWIPWMWRFRSRDPLFSNGCRLLVNSNTIGCKLLLRHKYHASRLVTFFGMVKTCPLTFKRLDMWPPTFGDRKFTAGSSPGDPVFDFADQFGTAGYRHGLKKMDTK